MIILDWRRIVVYTHRWLGIAGALLFAGWFASGVVMMYARMPRLSPEERLMRLPALDLSKAAVDPADAARMLPRPPDRLRVGMLAGRPVYRFHCGPSWTTIFADTGKRLTRLDAIDAVAAARTFEPGAATILNYDGRVTDPDQWTLQIRGLLPAQRVALNDRAATHLYVAEQTGEVVLRTTRQGRVWGYLGAVVHWIYFTPIRRHSDAWVQLIIWTSIAGCLTCLLGLVWGVWRYSPGSRFRLRRTHQHSPYAGMMRWHHYAGLLFGVVTFTWVFSGLLSMNPWDWSPDTSASLQQRRAMSGGSLAIDQLNLAALRAVEERLTAAFPVKEIELLQFRGELYGEAYRAPTADALRGIGLGDPAAVLAARAGTEHRVVSVAHPERELEGTFDETSLVAAARDAMPNVEVKDITWLGRYDAYYYDRNGALPLPVLRVRYSDAVSTWLYLDPRRGEIVRKEERLTRINRWLYHGLHSLDFPWLYQRRPLWDLVVIVLSAGGVVVSLSSAPAAFRRLRRHVRRVRASSRS